MTRTEIVVCGNCDGKGYRTRHVTTCYHKGEYDVHFDSCYKCGGSGLLQRTTTVTEVPFVAGPPGR